VTRRTRTGSKSYTELNRESQRLQRRTESRRAKEEDADADFIAATLEGIFVYGNSSGVDVSVGNVVHVQGTVSEYYDHTQLGSVTNAVVCPGTAIATAATVSLPISDVANWEHTEGMLVRIPQTLYVTDNYNQGRYGEVELSGGRARYPGFVRRQQIHRHQEPARTGTDL
jgi:predicted extracellular nuclease